jgi:uncharacterized protein DUF6781
MTSAAAGGPTTEHEHAVRDRMRRLVSRLLREGHIDTEGVREITRAIAAATSPEEAVETARSQADIAMAIRQLDAALAVSAEQAHRTLEVIASRGAEATENDMKNALASLARLQEDCLAATRCLSEAAQGNLRQELDQLAVHAQNVGAEASARVAAMVNEFVSGVRGVYRETAAPGLETARAFSVRMALLTSGIMAGIADALGEQPRRDKPE